MPALSDTIGYTLTNDTFVAMFLFGFVFSSYVHVHYQIH
jgi:hypothetical protein